MTKTKIIQYIRGMLKQFVNPPYLTKACLLATALAATVMLLTAPAQAQTQPTEILLTNKAGCKLYHPATAEVVDAQLLNVVGNCVNGFFQGSVLYGVSWKVKQGNEPAQDFIGMRIGVVQQGRFDGLRMAINQGGRLFLTPPNNIASFRTVREQPDYSLPQLLNAINTEAIKAGGQYASANRDYLTNIAKTWDQNPYGMMKEYTDDYSNPRVANNGTASAPAAQISNNNSAPASQANTKGGTSDAEKLALTQSCSAESKVMLSRGTEEAKTIMSRSGDARSGFRVVANSLMANMKMYQGRCRGATNSTGNIAQSAKLLLQISQSCAAAGFGSDCDEMRKVAQTTTPNESSTNSTGGSSASSSSNSGSGNASAAGDCLSAVRKNTGGLDLKNNCTYVVEAGWCVVGYDCKNGDWGYSSQVSIAAGQTWPISGSINRTISFGGCTPKNANVSSVSKTEYACKN